MQVFNIMKQYLHMDNEFNENSESYGDLLVNRKRFIDRNA
jgi:hypothetical protein